MDWTYCKGIEVRLHKYLSLPQHNFHTTSSTHSVVVQLYWQWSMKNWNNSYLSQNLRHGITSKIRKIVVSTPMETSYDTSIKN